MKKSVILFSIIIILAVTTISAHNSNYNHEHINDFYDLDRINTNNFRIYADQKTFQITKSNGRTHSITYYNYNRDRIVDKSSNAGPRRRGIFGNFFERDHKPRTRNKLFFKTFKTRKNVHCPPGWKCTSVSYK